MSYVSIGASPGKWVHSMVRLLDGNLEIGATSVI